MVMTKIGAMLAPKLLTIFIIGAIIVFFIYIFRKTKKMNEESRRREEEFFAAHAELIIAQKKREEAQSEYDEEKGCDVTQSIKEAEAFATNNNHKIVVLDGQVLNPGDLSWDGFKRFGEITIYDRTPQEQVEDRMKDADIVITNKAIITGEIMKSCPKLKYIGVIATGYNVVDVEAAGELGITVTNVPGYGTDAVAQFTFALMLEMCNQVGLHATSVMEGDWSRHPDFSYWLAPITDIKGKTLGIIGYGSIGARVAELALAFGMEVLLYSRTKKPAQIKAKWVSFDELLERSDIITLHCPLTKENEKLINADTIARMKDGARLINTARGGLVDETAMVEALNSGKLAGAALDVISSEPMKEDSPLFDAKNLIVTPHIAWASKEARERLMEIAVSNVKTYLDGKPRNVVS